jgi:alpha-galactosidase
VTATTPANAATGVARSVKPSATFSEAIDATTLTSTTFTLSPSGGSAVAATVSYDATSRTATLSPSSTLAAATTYTARVKGGSTGVADLAGNRLAADATWSFTTASASATTSYLSDLAWVQIANGWGPVEKDMSNGEQAAGDGHPITLNGTVYAKGLGAHAASEVDLALNGACSSFTTSVGVDDEVPSTNGSIVFQIWGDGTKLADSGLMTGATATKSYTVDLTGRTTLKLIITDGGNGINSDHGDWAGSQITCG